MFWNNHKKKMDQKKGEQFFNSVIYAPTKEKKQHSRLSLHSELNTRLSYNHFKELN